MPSFAPIYTVTRLDAEREIHWTAAGLWDHDDAIALHRELLAKSKPFRDDRQGFRVLGDLREWLVQKSDFTDYMQASQDTAAQLGVDKMVILYSSTLLKQQFRRVSGSLDCQFFTDRTEALKWLRSNETSVRH